MVNFSMQQILNSPSFKTSACEHKEINGIHVDEYKFSDRIEIIVRKVENPCFPGFSPFPTMP